MPKLYIIAGPNGAGKTTFSYAALPELFQCKEFVNADEIARGLSPFQPDSASMLAGRLMMQRINEHIERGETFAFETTLATRSFAQLIQLAKAFDYEVILLFLYLDSVALAQRRVAVRVVEGGHNVPPHVIERRYQKGLKNLFRLYQPIVDRWVLADNSSLDFELIAEQTATETLIHNASKWRYLQQHYDQVHS